MNGKNIEKIDVPGIEPIKEKYKRRIAMIDSYLDIMEPDDDEEIQDKLYAKRNMYLGMIGKGDGTVVIPKSEKYDFTDAERMEFINNILETDGNELGL